MTTKPHAAWTIAGSDSGGLAGIQVDLRVFEAFGVHGCSALTAVTAQNPVQCSEVTALGPATVVSQLNALAQYFTPSAVKTGLLANEALIEAVANQIAPLRTFLTVDPVCVSSSGYQFLDTAALRAYETYLFPFASVVTPNLDEAIAFSGSDDCKTAAAYFLTTKAQSVLLKGGHRLSDNASDYWSDGKESFYLSSPRRALGPVSGTGCSLAAALTSAKALGMETGDALVVAKAYLNRALRLATPLGNTQRLHHAGWPVEAEDFPVLHTESFRQRPPFATCAEPIGFYPIVDRAAWVERLVQWGARTIQLRIKDLSGEALRREIREAITCTRPLGVQLFINDYWDLALAHEAYGVHLGQEDLATADLDRLQKSGVRLGISTHSYKELAIAHYFHPSYVALGPVFPTTCKSMRFGPQGFTKLQIWNRLCEVPVVAIGGLRTEHIAELSATGATGFAVVSDVLHHRSPEARSKEWLQKTKEALG